MGWFCGDDNLMSQRFYPAALLCRAAVCVLASSSRCRYSCADPQGHSVAGISALLAVSRRIAHVPLLPLLPPLDLVDQAQHIVAAFLAQSEECQYGGAEHDAGGPPHPRLGAIDGGVPDLREHDQKQKRHTHE